MWVWGGETWPIQPRGQRGQGSAALCTARTIPSLAQPFHPQLQPDRAQCPNGGTIPIAQTNGRLPSLQSRSKSLSQSEKKLPWLS